MSIDDNEAAQGCDDRAHSKLTSPADKLQAANGKKPFKIDRSILNASTSVGAPSLSCALRRSGSTCCGGRGYVIGTQGAYAHATLCSCVKNCPACFGRARMMDGNDSRSCREVPPNVAVNLINAAMIPARYADSSLSGFQNHSGNGREFIQRLSKWKTQFRPKGGAGLVISGPVGVGKTFILAALAKSLAMNGYSVRFTDFFQLLCELRAGFSEGKADTSQLMPLIDVDVLVIDELGKGRNRDFDRTVLDQLVCGRYNQNRTIIASTNYILEGRGTSNLYANANLERETAQAGEFDRFGHLEDRVGTRIFSRLKEMTHFWNLSGEDFRRLAHQSGSSSSHGYSEHSPPSPGHGFE